MDHDQQIGERGGLGPRRGRWSTIRSWSEPREPGPNLRRRGPINGQSGAMNVQVVVYGLPQQRDFKHTLLLKPLAFFNDVVRRSMNFRTACVGHYAVGAELVAASGDPDIGRSTCEASLVGVESTGKVEQFQAFPVDAVLPFVGLYFASNFADKYERTEKLRKEEEEQKRIEEEKELEIKQKLEEEQRILEEERRLKEWEEKFDLEQKKKEEELIKKFYSDNSSNKDEPEEKND